MKISKEGSNAILKNLLSRFGFEPGMDVEIEISRDGILVKPAESHRAQVADWLRNEHGSEMATLTTDQLMRLIQEDH